MMVITDMEDIIIFFHRFQKPGEKLNFLWVYYKKIHFKNTRVAQNIMVSENSSSHAQQKEY